jgi:undecaprenyl diphosphate synthase
MKILIKSLKKELTTLQNNNIKLNTIGNLEKMPQSAQKELLDVIEKTIGRLKETHRRNKT